MQFLLWWLLASRWQPEINNTGINTVYKLSEYLILILVRKQHFFKCWLHRWRNPFLQKPQYWLVLNVWYTLAWCCPTHNLMWTTNYSMHLSIPLTWASHGIHVKVARVVIRDWMSRKHGYWQSIHGQRQANGFVKRFSAKETLLRAKSNDWAANRPLTFKRTSI